ncbi:MAG: DUF4252 domain-containing protein [Bacteroidota bacterium]
MKKWSYLLLTALFCAVTSLASAQADAISKYFNQYLDDERFTVVYISPKMFQLIGKLEIDADMEDDEVEAVMNMVEDLRGLRILVSDVDVDALYAEAISKINTKEYEILMTVRSKNESDVQFLVKDENDGNTINELLMLVGGEDSFVLMSFVGKINLNKVSDLSKTFSN